MLSVYSVIIGLFIFTAVNSNTKDTKAGTDQVNYDETSTAEDDSGQAQPLLTDDNTGEAVDGGPSAPQPVLPGTRVINRQNINASNSGNNNGNGSGGNTNPPNNPPGNGNPPPQAMAARWTGIRSNDWEDPANWDVGQVPDSTATVTVQPNGRGIRLNSSKTVKDLIVLADGVMEFNGQNVTVTGTFSNEGTIKLKGNEILNIPKDVDSGTVEYIGDSTTNYAQLPYGNHYKNLVINSTTGGNRFSTSGTLVINGKLTIQSGTLNLNGNDLIISQTPIAAKSGFLSKLIAFFAPSKAYAWPDPFENEGVLQLIGDEDMTGFTNDIDSGTIEYIGTGSYTGLNAGTAYWNLTFSGSGTYTINQSTDVNSNITINAGTVNANVTLNVGANFDYNGGSFNALSGTVVLDSSNASIISGSNTFNNLTCTTPGKAIYFEAGSTQVVGNILTLTGQAHNLIALRSTSANTRWQINPQSTWSISYVDVRDSNNINGTDLDAADSHNAGNNLNWTFTETGDSAVVVTVPINSTISLGCNDNITMGGILSSGKSNLATNEINCSVVTNNSAGYSLTWQAAAASGRTNATFENASGTTIDAISRGASPSAWPDLSSSAGWGARLKSTSTYADTTKWGTTDDYDSATSLWHNVTTSPYTIISVPRESQPAGDSEIVQIGAEVGAGHFQQAGDYTVNIVMTAITL